MPGARGKAGRRAYQQHGPRLAGELRDLGRGGAGVDGHVYRAGRPHREHDDDGGRSWCHEVADCLAGPNAGGAQRIRQHGDPGAQLAKRQRPVAGRDHWLVVGERVAGQQLRQGAGRCHCHHHYK
jgi:hypothetical protein